MATIQFTDEEVEQLAYERFYHPHPRVQRKMESVFLKAKGLPLQRFAIWSGLAPIRSAVGCGTSNPAA